MKKANFLPLIIIVSVLIPAVVTALYFVSIPKVDLGFDLLWFPRFNAIMNTLTTLMLLIGLFFIKQKNIQAHKYCMTTAIILSVFFLLSYVTYHSMAESTSFGGEGVLKYIYYFVLITHIILAAVIVPLVLITFVRALMNDFAKHRKIAKWTLPLWLYVTVTGVMVYLMISPYY